MVDVYYTIRVEFTPCSKEPGKEAPCRSPLEVEQVSELGGGVPRVDGRFPGLQAQVAGLVVDEKEIRPGMVDPVHAKIQVDVVVDVVHLDERRAEQLRTDGHVEARDPEVDVELPAGDVDVVPLVARFHGKMRAELDGKLLRHGGPVPSVEASG